MKDVNGVCLVPAEGAVFLPIRTKSPLCSADNAKRNYLVETFFGGCCDSLLCFLCY